MQVIMIIGKSKGQAAGLMLMCCLISGKWKLPLMARQGGAGKMARFISAAANRKTPCIALLWQLPDRQDMPIPPIIMATARKGSGQLI